MPVGAGTRVDPYEVIALLAEGGIGKVWRARHSGPADACQRPDVCLQIVGAAVGTAPEYTRPWTVTLNQDLADDTELLDCHYTDNEKSVGRMVGK